MSGRIPSFLLGGINLTYNFLGTRTAQTAGFGIFETGIRLTPVLLVFIAASQDSNGADERAAQVMVPPESIAQRRSSLTQ